MEKKQLTRRTFVAGAAVAGAAVAGASLLTGCKKAQAGGIFKYYVNEPSYIDVYNLQESEGTQVSSQIFDGLVDFDFKKEAIVPAAASKWEVSADATVFTFHLRQGATFHNGDPVTAADFKRGFERICNPNIAADPSEISYHLAQIKGYDEMFEKGTAKELSGVKAIDELTLEITLTAPYADFLLVLTHPALSPVPKAADDLKTFSEAPIGNGPFMIKGKWEHDQYIQVLRFDDYYGDKAYVDGIDFHIITEVETAFQEFKAGSLDFCQIAPGQIEECVAEYGESPDGWTAQPGQQSIIGPQSATYYLIINNSDPILKNQKLREAISYAINRQAICDVVFQGTRVPADGIIPPGIAGYRAGAWKTAVYDVEKAKAALAEAGYPDGKGLDTLKLSFNTGGGHDQIMRLIQGDLKSIGIETNLDSMEWAAYLSALAAGNIQMGRLGWIADYPIMENFLFSLFYTNNGDNYSRFSNKDADKGIMEARGITDDNQRVKAFQAVDDIIQAATPVAPVMFYRHSRVTSARVNDFFFGPNMIADMAHTWLS
ncbi:MAG: peptide ABC transporter substrate-binding protein [Coriobacteriales bacterium]|jgi:peptide/nickel transport system substrate-binding protein/oligopeptide transport system substrate-binding protein|nr:peptide ABC transporter substrate-binding protein [Coriobacteriales bacterium]